MARRRKGPMPPEITPAGLETNRLAGRVRELCDRLAASPPEEAPAVRVALEGAQGELLAAMAGMIGDTIRDAQKPGFDWAYWQDDLASACRIGVLEAAREHAEAKGAFTNQARFYMQTALSHHGYNLTRRIGSYRAVAGALRQKAVGGVDPPAKRAALATARVLEGDGRPGGLEWYALPSSPPPDLVAEESAREADRARVARVLGELARRRPRDAAMVRMRMGLDGHGPRTLREVGRAFNVKQERVRQILGRAMVLMRIYDETGMGGEVP